MGFPWREFGCTGKEGTCLLCGEKLKYPGDTGDQGDSYFCNLDCAYQWAIKIADVFIRITDQR